MTVVGVVGDVHQTITTEPVRPEIYFTYAQDPVPFFQRATLVARTDRAAAPAITALRRVITSVAVDVPVTDAQSLTTIVARALDPPRFNTSLLSLLAVLALVLAAIGMYGVIGYTVSLRRREIGVRMALGAGRRRIFGHVVGRSLALVACGLAVGLVGALAFGRVLRGMLFETSPLDLGTVSLAMFGVAAVAACAAFFPAQKATHTDPIASLRPD